MYFLLVETCAIIFHTIFSENKFTLICSAVIYSVLYFHVHVLILQIKSFFGLAPVATVGHIKGALPLLADLLPELQVQAFLFQYHYYYYYSFNVRHLRTYAGQTLSPRCHISMHRANKSRSD